MTRTVVVTGAVSGIGAALSALLASRGDTVIDVDLADASVVADLSTPEGRASAIRDIAERAGDVIDAVVTCAGTTVPSLTMVGVNYFGTTELAVGLQPLLAAGSAGRLVVIGSISGTRPVFAPLVEACLAGEEHTALTRAQEAIDAGKPHEIYSSTKSALAQWARRMAVSPGWADAGIAVNVVAPGVILTPMSAPMIADPAMKKVMDVAVPMPLNGYAAPEAPARLLAWLAGEENTHVTGQVIYCDGGAEVSTRPADQF